MNTPRTSPRHAQQGFTLVVIAALFIAFSVIGAVAVERNTIVQQITRREAAADQLTRLSNAIIEYSVFNRTSPGGINLYPCPAPLTVTPSTGTFGTGVTACWSTAGDTASATSTGIPIMGTGMLRGMVPVQDLASYGISINDAFDPWNNRIMYVVNRGLTANGATNGAPANLAAQANNPTLTETLTGISTIAKPDFILISYGRDGVGAYKRSDTTVAIACAAASTVLRLENCDVDTNFSQQPTSTGTNATAANYFDDILSYYRQ